MVLIKNKFFSKRFELPSILLIFLIVRIKFMLTYHLPWWDEAVYIGLGKYVFSLGQIGLLEASRPFLLSFFLGLGWKLGFDPLLLGQIIGTIFLLCTLALVYLITEKLTNRYMAVLCTFFIALLPEFFLNSTRILTSIPSTCFTLLAVYLFITNKDLIYVGMAAGIAFLFRFPNGIIAPAMFAVFFVNYLEHKDFVVLLKTSLRFGIPFGTVILPNFLYSIYMYKNPFKFLLIANEAVMSKSLWLYDKGLLFYFQNLFEQSFVTILILVFVFFYFYKRWYKNEKINSVFFIFLLISLYLIYNAHKEARYLVIMLPYLAILIFVGITQLTKSILSKKNYFRIALTMILLVMIVYSLRPMIEQDKVHLKWRYQSEPSEIKDIFMYFENNNFQGPIMSGTPLLAIYSDNLIVPMYFTYEDTLDFMKFHDIKGVLYEDNYMPCQEDDNICIENKKDIIERINEDFTFKKKVSFLGSDYEIYD